MEPSHAASSHQKSHQCIKKRYSLGSDKLILSSSPPDFSGIIIHPPPPSAGKKKKHPSGEKWKKLFILTQLCLAKLVKLTCTFVIETREGGGVRQRGQCSRAPYFFTISVGKFFNLLSDLHIVWVKFKDSFRGCKKKKTTRLNGALLDGMFHQSAGFILHVC